MGRAMGRKRFGGDTTVSPVLGNDGRVYFDLTRKPASERIVESVIGVLWGSVAIVIITALIWL